MKSEIIYFLFSFLPDLGSLTGFRISPELTDRPSSCVKSTNYLRAVRFYEKVRRILYISGLSYPLGERVYRL